MTIVVKSNNSSAAKSLSVAVLPAIAEPKQKKRRIAGETTMIFIPRVVFGVLAILLVVLFRHTRGLHRPTLGRRPTAATPGRP